MERSPIDPFLTRRCSRGNWAMTWLPQGMAKVVSVPKKASCMWSWGEMCSLSTQFEKFTYLIIIHGLCALLHRCLGSRGHLWTRNVTCQVFLAITRVAHHFTANCSLRPAAFSTALINWLLVSRHADNEYLEYSSAVCKSCLPLEMRARTRQARLV